MRLVLKLTSSEIDIRLIASINHWQLQGEISADKATPKQIIWTLPESDTRVTYVEDALLGINYLLVTGQLEMQAVEALQNGLEIYSRSEIDPSHLRHVDPAEAEKLVHVIALMAADGFDRKTFDLFAAALAHPAVSVRRAAVFGVTYAPWQSLRELLVKCQAEDPEIGQDVEIVLNSIDQHGWLGDSGDDGMGPLEGAV